MKTRLSILLLCAMYAPVCLASQRIPIAALTKYVSQRDLTTDKQKQMERERRFHAWTKSETPGPYILSIDGFNGVADFSQVRLSCSFIGKEGHAATPSERDGLPEYCQRAFAELYQAIAGSPPPPALVSSIKDIAVAKESKKAITKISDDKGQLSIRVTSFLWGYDHEEIWPTFDFDVFPKAGLK